MDHPAIRGLEEAANDLVTVSLFRNLIQCNMLIEVLIPVV